LGDGVVTVSVTAVGKRDKLAVYNTVAQRNADQI
jgi:hypothetical protein